MLVGLLGKKRSGKDTLASFLVSDHGFTRYAFADPLKAAALATDPLIRVEPDETGQVYGPGGVIGVAHYERLSTIVGDLGWDRAKDLREVRRYLQALGVAMREHVDEDLWVRTTLERAQRTPGPVVITDVRFPNEADEVQRRGGFLVRIVRPDRPEGFGDNHVSETALDGRVVNFIIPNDGTLDDLRTWATRLAAAVRR